MQATTVAQTIKTCKILHETWSVCIWICYCMWEQMCYADHWAEPRCDDNCTNLHLLVYFSCGCSEFHPFAFQSAVTVYKTVIVLINIINAKIIHLMLQMPTQRIVWFQRQREMPHSFKNNHLRVSQLT